MYSDPMFIAAEVAYRRQLLTATGGRRVGTSHRHDQGWTDRLHLRLPHRHLTQVRPA